MRERGLKLFDQLYNQKRTNVAPVRERGLKSTGTAASMGKDSRSREGAWIEIF
mgnify:CR=1 FL=1